jgi:tripartite-type tricarboxylate transporter receptor subunit TctC
VKDLIALAKAKPGSLNMAIAGLGTAVHLGCEQFRQEAGIEVITVPYRGGGPSLIDLLAAKVDFTFSTILAVLEHIRGGKLKALGITTGPVAQLPGVHGMADAVLPKVDAVPDFGIVAPAKVAPPIIQRLSEVARSVIKSDDMKRRLQEIGYDLVGSTPEEYAAHIDTPIEKWSRIIAAGNIRPEVQ